MIFLDSTVGEILASGAGCSSWIYPSRSFIRHWRRFDNREVVGDREIWFLAVIESRCHRIYDIEAFAAIVAANGELAMPEFEKKSYYWQA